MSLSPTSLSTYLNDHKLWFRIIFAGFRRKENIWVSEFWLRTAMQCIFKIGAAAAVLICNSELLQNVIIWWGYQPNSAILWQESLHRIILSSFKFPATIFRSFNGIFKGIGWRAGISSIYMCNWEHDSPYCPYLFIHFTYYSLNVPTWKVLKSKIVTCYLISWHQNVLNNLGGERDCFVLCYLGLCWILVQRSIKSSLSCSIYWAQISLQGKWTQITSNNSSYH